jgi:hypothetical protein
MEVKTDKPDIEHLIWQTFPEEYEVMLAIAICESGLNQNAVSHTNDYGIFQVNQATWDSVAKEMGLDYKNSVADNLKMARYVYDVQGIDAWVCHSKNLHLAYLN